MKFISKLSDGIFQIEKFLSIIFASAMLVSLFLGVLYRYAFKSPLLWSDETAIFSLVWLTFIGGSMGIKQQQSAAVTLLMDKFYGKTRMILLGFGLLVVLLFVSFIFYLSINWLSSPNILIQKSNSMQMPMIFPYLSIPVSFIFIAVHSLDLLVKNFKSTKEA